MLRSLLVCFTLIMFTHNATAGDYDGTWIMNANGWQFTLKIEENDGKITGTMTGINNDQKSTIEGKVNGNEITFSRDGTQDYTGFLLNDDPTGKTNKLNIAGTFKAGDAQSGWFAKR